MDEKRKAQIITRKTERGQVLLIIVLIMVVSLTVGLAVVSRSIVNIRTSTEEENSQRAFSAAEAGIEKVLKSGNSIDSPVSLEAGKTEIKQATTNVIEGTSFLLNGGNPVEKDDGADIWLVAHNTDGTPNYTTPWTGSLTLYWGLTGGACPNIAAMEIITISGNLSAPSSNRYVYDPCSSRGNNFSSPTVGPNTINDKTFNYRTTIAITNGFIVRATPLYTSTPIGVTATVALPSQGKRVESIGESGGTTRKISLFQGWRKLPSEFFQHVAFSP